MIRENKKELSTILKTHFRESTTQQVTTFSNQADKFHLAYLPTKAEQNL